MQSINYRSEQSLGKASSLYIPTRILSNILSGVCCCYRNTCSNYSANVYMQANDNEKKKLTTGIIQLCACERVCSVYPSVSSEFILVCLYVSGTRACVFDGFPFISTIRCSESGDPSD